MKRKHALFLLLILICSFTAGQASAEQGIIKEPLSLDEDGRGVVRVFSQVTSHGLPTGWKVGFRTETPAHFMLEFVPKDESVENWKTMFTLQGFRNLAEKTDAKTMLGLAGMQQKKVCGESLIFELIEEEPISGFPAQGAIIGCSKVPHDLSIGLKKGMAEIAYYIAVKGKKDIYLFHKGIRGKAFDKNNSPITKHNAKEFIKDFLPIQLTDP